MTDIVWDAGAPPLDYLKFEYLEAFLRTAGLPTEIVCKPGPQRPDVPGAWVVITPYGGPGPSVAGVFDQRAFQVLCAGYQRRPETSEELANRIDHAFMQHRDEPILLGSLHVLEFNRGPAPQILEREDERDVYVCSYGTEIESYG